MFLANLLVYIAAFVFIWFGAGLIITSASKFSSRLKLSPFAFSFIVLGLLTSIPEFSVGLQAVASDKAEIFVGNLLGGIVVLFLVVIPLLAIFGNGINLKREVDNKKLILILVVILLPALFVLDKRVTNLEGVILILSYLILVFVVEKKDGILDNSNSQLLNIKAYSYKDLLRILIGILVVFVASNLIVARTLYFAEVFRIPAFYISLLVIALGTDLPELTLAARSVLLGKKDLAMGDYIGAASASTFMFGLFTILHNGEVLTISNFFVTFIFITLALALYYFYGSGDKFLTRKEGFVMFLIYFAFVAFELIR